MSTTDPVGDPGRDACLSWLKRRLDADVRRAPDLLWHYTDAGGLLSIVAHERLWATQTTFLNDSTEMAYGLRLVTSALGSYDPGNLKEATARHLERLFDPRRATFARFFDKNLEVYVTCFCAEGDLLSQWRAYAGRDDAGGYALGMGTDPPLQGWPQGSFEGHDVALRRVLYDPVEQEEACHELIDTLVPILDADPKDPELQKSFARNLVSGVVESRRGARTRRSRRSRSGGSCTSATTTARSSRSGTGCPAACWCPTSSSSCRARWSP